MGPDFEAIHGAEGWQLSNPPILQLAALRASMEIFHEVGMERLRRKSELLTGYLEFLLDNTFGDELSIITPRDPQQRGAQLSLRIARNAKQVLNTLTEHGAICDWREPDMIRVAPVPLYNKFAEVYEFVQILNRILETGDGKRETGRDGR